MSNNIIKAALLILLTASILSKKIEITDKMRALFNPVSNMTKEYLKKYINFTEDPLTITDKLINKANKFKRYLHSIPQGDNCANRKDYKIPEIFQYLPAYKGLLKKEGDSLSFKNFCFNKNTITIQKLSKNAITLNIEITESQSYECQDIILLFTSSIIHFKTLSTQVHHKIILKNLQNLQINEIKTNGLKIFTLCDSIEYTISSIIRTFLLIKNNPAPPSYPIDPKDDPQDIDFILFKNMEKYIDYETIEKENINFLKTYANIKVELRPNFNGTALNVEQYIQSGDYFALSHIVSGESIMMQYFTGSAASHSAVALRDPDSNQLYIFESDYRGLFKRTWADFVKDQLHTMHSVAWFPLRKEYRDKFNAKKAWEWANKKVGLPYGSKNYIAATFDSAEEGFADFVAPQHFSLIMSFIEPMNNDMFINMMIDMINVRMKTRYTSMKEAGEYLALKNLTIEEVIAMPELDSYYYINGENYICSAYVASIFKQGGIFEGYDINAMEFSPKDLYLLDIYEKNFQESGPKECIEADKGLGYCMILGKYRINAEGFNTVKMYDRMFERCGTQAPLYKRKEGC